MSYLKTPPTWKMHGSMLSSRILMQEFKQAMSDEKTGSQLHVKLSSIEKDLPTHRLLTIEHKQRIFDALAKSRPDLLENHFRARNKRRTSNLQNKKPIVDPER